MHMCFIFLPQGALKTSAVFFNFHFSKNIKTNPTIMIAPCGILVTFEGENPPK